MRSGSLRYVPAIDGLRAIAVLLVFAAHTVPGFVAGRVGVDLFFVISGYLICSILLEELAGRGEIDVRAFYRRRLVRLGPPLVALVTVHVALSPVWAAYGVAPGRLLLVWVAALTYCWNLLLVTVGPVPGIQGSLSHLWSLAQEEQFYLVLPLVLLVVHRFAPASRLLLRLLCLGLCGSLALYVVTAPSIVAEFSPVTRGMGLLAGCVLAVVLHRRPTRAVPGPAAAVAVGVLGLVVWGCTSHRLPESLDIPVAVVAGTVLVGHLATTRRSVLQVALSGRMIVRLGLVSYAFYLWHLPCVVLARDVLGLGPWWVAGGALAVSLGLAAATLRFVERPARRLNERWRTAPADPPGRHRSPSSSPAAPRPAGPGRPEALGP